MEALVVVHLTKIPGVPQRVDAVRGMAYFRGTGPAGKVCGECAFYFYLKQVQRANGQLVTVRHRGCRLFKTMTGRHGPRVDRSMPSCKYFEALGANKGK